LPGLPLKGIGPFPAFLAYWKSLRKGAFLTVNAHFDGKAIIPDEPLDLPPNQALILQIERVGPRATAEESVLAWLAANAVEDDALPTDLADQHNHYLYGSPTKDRPR